MMRPIHMRMARAALDWTLQDLEKHSGVGRNTISRYEAGHDILGSSLQNLERTLTNEGIVFLDDDQNYGIKIAKKRHRPKG